MSFTSSCSIEYEYCPETIVEEPLVKGFVALLAIYSCSNARLIYPSMTTWTFVQASCHSLSRTNRAKALPDVVRFVIPSSAPIER